MGWSVIRQRLASMRRYSSLVLLVTMLAMTATVGIPLFLDGDAPVARGGTVTPRWIGTRGFLFGMLVLIDLALLVEVVREARLRWRQSRS